MAQRKTSYTNADLKTGGPATEYGPWTTKRGDPYEDMLSEPMSVEDIISDAKQHLRKPTVLGDIDRARWDQDAAGAQQYAEAGSTLGGQIKQDPWGYTKRGLRGGALAASIPAGIATGGVGGALAALLGAGSLGMEGYSYSQNPATASEAPSALEMGLAGLSAIPGGKALSGAAKTTGKAMSPGKAAWNAERSAAWAPEQAGPAYRPLTRARMPKTSSVEVGPLPPTPHTPQNTGTAWAPGNMPQSRWGTFTGKTGSQLPSGLQSAQEDMLTTLNPKWDPIARNSQISRGEGLPSELDDIPASIRSLTDDVPEFTQVDTPPVGGYETYQGVGAANSTDEVVGELARTARGAPASKARSGPSAIDDLIEQSPLDAASRRTGRPPADYLHGFGENGPIAGFGGAGKISERELARMQKVTNRMGFR